MSPKCKTNPNPLILPTQWCRISTKLFSVFSDFVHNRSRSLMQPLTGLTYCNVLSSWSRCMMQLIRTAAVFPLLVCEQKWRQCICCLGWATATHCADHCNYHRSWGDARTHIRLILYSVWLWKARSGFIHCTYGNVRWTFLSSFIIWKIRTQPY